MESQIMHYTLTGAADWPMLSIIGGVSFVLLQAIVLVLIGAIYRSLPKHSDLQLLRENVNLDIEKLAVRFESVLEKHMSREESNREKKEGDIMSFVKDGRKECQERYDKMFDDLFSRLR
jgi:hypothetical protein